MIPTPELVDAPPFVGFPSIARLSRDMIVTEKIDGTNASIHITDDGRVFAGSRNRWITPDADNFGFARWVKENEEQLRALGPGTHFGEWWGQGIQRRYGLSEKRFSLFNTYAWHSDYNDHEADESTSTFCHEVPVCHVVPVILRHSFDTEKVNETLEWLAAGGSAASPGFMQPEGVVVFHVKANQLFKKTLDKNDNHKGA